MSTPSVFALDIGTRKIAGLILEKQQDSFFIQEAVIREQLPGAMHDGQIHDIGRVAQTIIQVKDELSEKIGLPLHSAAVAAAGRSLLTCHGQARQALSMNQEITPVQEKTLELSSVQNALHKVPTNNTKKNSVNSYLCVGYTVIKSLLDDQPIAKLAGHRGQWASVEVIATFLPKVVVNSLATALKQAKLEMQSLTLEPIAAIHTVVPDTMRMLNLALVDIGAGTSDIAITRDGTIKAYGMVPEAGDEITTAIADHYLLDFMTAEKMKRALTTGLPLVCQDALTNPLELTQDELSTIIEPFVSDLALKICSEILTLNEDIPKGVILIGGGSLTPGIAQEIANHLELPKHLVRIRERQALTNVLGNMELVGPGVITPIGIGCNHLDGLSMEMQKITINDTSYPFLKLPQAKIGDALFHSGYTIRDLFSKPGEALIVTYNNQKITIPGSLGDTAKILKNQKPASLDTPVDNGDDIRLDSPRAGKNGSAFLREILPKTQSGMNVRINGNNYALSSKVLVNGHKKNLDYALCDGDHVTTQILETIQDALEATNTYTPYTLDYYLNNQKRSVMLEYTLKANNAIASFDDRLVDNMDIEYKVYPTTISDVTNYQTEQTIRVYINDQEVILTPTHDQTKPICNGEHVSMHHEINSNDRIEYHYEPHSGFILSDIFRVYEPSISEKHRNIQITINDKPVGYTDCLVDGDKIQFITRDKAR